jgi:hypothetical protein
LGKAAKSGLDAVGAGGRAGGVEVWAGFGGDFEVGQGEYLDDVEVADVDTEGQDAAFASAGEDAAGKRTKVIAGGAFGQAAEEADHQATVHPGDRLATADGFEEPVVVGFGGRGLAEFGDGGDGGDGGLA